MSGLVGGSGNLWVQGNERRPVPYADPVLSSPTLCSGGVGWSIGYRFSGSYARGTWIIGVGSMAISLACVLIPPISRKQRQAGGYMAQ